MMEQQFIFPFVKGRCHGNQLKSKNRPIFFVALPFWKRLQYHNSDFKILTLCSRLSHLTGHLKNSHLVLCPTQWDISIPPIYTVLSPSQWDIEKKML